MAFASKTNGAVLGRIIRILSHVAHPCERKRMSARGPHDRLSNFDNENVSELADFLKKVGNVADESEENGILHFHEEYDGAKGNEESRRVVFTEKFEPDDIAEADIHSPIKHGSATQDDVAETQREMSATMADLKRLMEMESSSLSVEKSSSRVDDIRNGKLSQQESSFGSGLRKGFLVNSKYSRRKDAARNCQKVSNDSLGVQAQSKTGDEASQLLYSGLSDGSTLNGTVSESAKLSSTTSNGKKKKRVSFSLPPDQAEKHAAPGSSGRGQASARDTATSKCSPTRKLGIPNVIMDSNWTQETILSESGLLENVEQAIRNGNDDNLEDDVEPLDRLEFIERLLEMEAEDEDEEEATELVQRDCDEFKIRQNEGKVSSGTKSAGKSSEGSFGTGFISGFLEPSTLPVSNKIGKKNVPTQSKILDSLNGPIDVVVNDKSEKCWTEMENEPRIKPIKGRGDTSKTDIQPIANRVLERSGTRRRPRIKSKVATGIGQPRVAHRLRDVDCDDNTTKRDVLEPILNTDEDDTAADAYGNEVRVSKFKKSLNARSAMEP